MYYNSDDSIYTLLYVWYILHIRTVKGYALHFLFTSKFSSLPRIYDKFQPQDSQDSMIFSGDYVVRCGCRKEKLIGAVGAAGLESQWM